MKSFLNKLSRRERLVMLIAAVALFVGGILYPAVRASGRYRQEKLDELDAARSLCAGYQAMLLSADQIRAENRELKEALSQTDGLLFDRTGNDVMMEASVIKLLNQLAPDLGLDISIAKSSLRGVSGQLNFSIKGSGRYPEILNFFYKLETHRPLIIVDSFDVAASQKGAFGGPGSFGTGRGSSAQRKAPSSMTTTGTSEPQMRLQMKIHINCQTATEGGQ